jgi:predicted Fe-Mo cluster-binding NifX family protein
MISYQKIAIPTSDGRLFQHFGKAPLVTVAIVENNTVTSKTTLVAPEHEHGSMPRFIKSHDCTDVICGGIGGGAADMLAEMNIALHAGAPSLDVDTILKMYIEGTITYGDGSCSHDSCGGHHHEHNHDNGPHINPSSLRLG